MQRKPEAHGACSMRQRDISAKEVNQRRNLTALLKVRILFLTADMIA
jgi:hypothetical protein